MALITVEYSVFGLLKIKWHNFGRLHIWFVWCVWYFKFKSTFIFPSSWLFSYIFFFHWNDNVLIFVGFCLLATAPSLVYLLFFPFHLTFVCMVCVVIRIYFSFSRLMMHGLLYPFSFARICKNLLDNPQRNVAKQTRTWLRPGEKKQAIIHIYLTCAFNLRHQRKTV